MELYYTLINIFTPQRADATSTAIIRIATLDRFSLEHRVVGYARVAMFIDPLGNQVRATKLNSQQRETQ